MSELSIAFRTAFAIAQESLNLKEVETPSRIVVFSKNEMQYPLPKLGKRLVVIEEASGITNTFDENGALEVL